MAARISYGAAPCALVLLFLLSTAAAASHHRKIGPGDTPLPPAAKTGPFMLTGPGGETIRTGELTSLAGTEAPRKRNKLIAAWSPVDAVTLGIGFYRNPKMGMQLPGGSAGGPGTGKAKKVPAIGMSIHF